MGFATLCVGGGMGMSMIVERRKCLFIRIFCVNLRPNKSRKM
jgi:hypothetical protein